MLPGKKYKPEDFLAIAWRHKWVIVVPLVLFSLGAFVYSRSLPNRYRSEAVVLIVPPQVSANVVKPVTSESLQERLDLMKQQILSRARLERIIEEFNLYPKERKSLFMDQIVETMKKDIGVTTQKVGRRHDPGHFVVRYDSENPQTAMVVTARIASLFVSENLQGRGIQAVTQSQFFQSQVDEAERLLREQQARVEQFRKANAGRLPEEVESNLRMMQNARQDLDAQINGINRDRDRQIQLQKTIDDEMALGPIASGRGRSGGAGVQSAAQELAEANAALAQLQLRLKDDHPDVKIAKSRVAELTKKAELEALQQPLADGRPAGPVNPADADRMRRLSTLRNELEGLGRSIKAKQARADRAQATITQYQNRVESAPTLESQYSALMLNHTTLKANYEGLLRKRQDAQISANLEERQAGEQFQIVDPARRPERPYSPDRTRINLIGALIGFGLGLAIAGLLEYRDTSVRSEEDVLVALSLPVLALVPTMQTAITDGKPRRRRWLLLGSSAGAMLVLSLVAVAWKLRLFANWME